jgi:hypothetical protein
MDPHLARLQEAIASATRGMSTAELARHPQGQPEGNWSAAEVLEHLYLTYTGTVKGFERCLQAAKPLATSPTLKQRLATLLVVTAGHMSRGRQAGPHLRPRGLPVETVMAEIGAKIAAMEDVITRCEIRHGQGVKLLDHPILGPLTAAQWRKFHWVHGQHHLKQIRRLRAGM